MSELATRLKVADVLVVTIGVDAVPIDMLRLNYAMYGITGALDGLEEYCAYHPSKFGPTSMVVNQTLEQLKKDGIITIGQKVALTEQGKNLRREIIEPKSGTLSEFLKTANRYTVRSALALIGRTKRNWIELTDDEFYILSYYTYPKFALESNIYEKLKPRKEEILTKLALNGKISIGLFSKYMGLGYEDGCRILLKKGYMFATK